MLHHSPDCRQIVAVDPIGQLRLLVCKKIWMAVGAVGGNLTVKLFHIPAIPDQLRVIYSAPVIDEACQHLLVALIIKVGRRRRHSGLWIEFRAN